MKILLIDTQSNFLDFAMRCQATGHDVLWWDRQRKDGSVRMAGKGMVEKILDYDQLRKKYLGWADLIFLADNTCYLDMLEPYRKIGYSIVGPSVASAELELDRALGQQFFKEAGLNIIPGVAFTDYEAAAQYVEKHPNYLVSKPSGDADKAMSYVAPDASSLLYMLRDRWSKNPKYVADAREHGFILQEKIDGCEFAVGGWFGPGGWCKYWYENFEYKKLMAGDLGPNTGEQGTLSMMVRHSKLADIALKPLTKALHALDYVGFIDVSGMVKVTDGTFWPFEVTARPGWPTEHNIVASIEGDQADWLLDLVNGKDTMRVKEDMACVSVVMAIPDYPYSKLTNKEVSDIPVYLHNADRDAVHLSEVKIGEAFCQVAGQPVRMPCYVTSGDYVCVVTGIGETITGARRSAYSTVSKIKMPADPFYRPDIGAGRIRKDLPALQRHGYALGFKI